MMTHFSVPPLARVYVDDAEHAYGRMLMCHMLSPDLAALHAMAAKIGVAKRWFQDPRTMPGVSRPHYDIAKSKRVLAIAAGAIPIDKYQMVAIASVAMARLPGRHGGTFADPLRTLRGRDGRPGHPELQRVEAWLEEQLEGRGVWDIAR